MENQIPKQLNVSLKDGTPVLCKCGCRNFMPLIRWFKFSALLTGSPKDSMMPVEVYVCGQCGETLQDMLPRELRETPKIEIDTTGIETR